MKIEKYKHHNLNDNIDNEDISELNLALYKVSKVARDLGYIEASDILDMATVVLDDEEKLKNAKIQAETFDEIYG